MNMHINACICVIKDIEKTFQKLENWSREKGISIEKLILIFSDIDLIYQFIIIYILICSPLNSTHGILPLCSGITPGDTQETKHGAVDMN